MAQVAATLTEAGAIIQRYWRSLLKRTGDVIHSHGLAAETAKNAQRFDFYCFFCLWSAGACQLKASFLLLPTDV